jgi:hypothetical protein
MSQTSFLLIPNSTPLEWATSSSGIGVGSGVLKQVEKANSRKDAIAKHVNATSAMSRARLVHGIHGIRVKVRK